MKTLIIASACVHDLTGNGYEALSDKEGNIIAVFACGFLASESAPIKTDASEAFEPTVVLRAA